MMSRRIAVLVLSAWVLAAADVAVAEFNLAVPDSRFDYQNLMVTSVGAPTAATVGVGNYVVGPAGAPHYARPITPFSTSSFHRIADGGTRLAGVSPLRGFSNDAVIVPPNG